MSDTHFPDIFEDPSKYYEFKMNSGELSPTYPEILRETLLKISENVPKLTNLNNEKIELILSSTGDIQKSILSNIAKITANNASSAKILREFAKSYFDIHCLKFIEEFNATSERKVLFITGAPSGQILREANALRKKGFSVAIVYMSPVNNDVTAAIAKSFNLSLQLPENLRILEHVLSKIQASLIHLQCFMHSSHLPYPSVVLENKGASKVVCEVVDILTIFSEKSALAQYDPEFAEFNFMLDEIIWTKGDGYIVRAPKIAHTDLRNTYGFSAPIIEMQQFPSEDLIRPIERGRYEPQGTPRLVFAGGLTPLRILDGKAIGFWPRYADGAGMLNAFESLTRQDFDVTVLHDPNRPLNNPDFLPYIEIDRSYPNFHLVEGVPYDQLSETLSKFDFGISLVTLDRAALDLREILFQTGVATKIFSYFEAGIPAIVNKEHEYTAEIVESNNLGIAIHTNELEKLGNKIAAFDYEKCLNSIDDYNHNCKIEYKIENVISLYDKLLF